MKRLDELTARVRQLMGSSPPTYEEFVKQWADMDELSKSLYATGIACPELIGATGPYWQAVRNHMERMGIQPEPFTLESILEGMGDG